MERREEGVRSEGKRESEHKFRWSTPVTAGEEARRERPLVWTRAPWWPCGEQTEGKQGLPESRPEVVAAPSAPSRSGCRGVGASRIHFESESTING